MTSLSNNDEKEEIYVTKKEFFLLLKNYPSNLEVQFMIDQSVDKFTKKTLPNIVRDAVAAALPETDGTTPQRQQQQQQQNNNNNNNRAAAVEGGDVRTPPRNENDNSIELDGSRSSRHLTSASPQHNNNSSNYNNNANIEWMETFIKSQVERSILRELPILIQLQLARQTSPPSHDGNTTSSGGGGGGSRRAASPPPPLPLAPVSPARSPPPAVAVNTAAETVAAADKQETAEETPSTTSLNPSSSNNNNATPAGSSAGGGVDEGQRKRELILNTINDVSRQVAVLQREVNELAHQQRASQQRLRRLCLALELPTTTITTTTTTTTIKDNNNDSVSMNSSTSNAPTTTTTGSATAALRAYLDSCWAQLRQDGADASATTLDAPSAMAALAAEPTPVYTANGNHSGGSTSAAARSGGTSASLYNVLNRLLEEDKLASAKGVLTRLLASLQPPPPPAAAAPLPQQLQELRQQLAQLQQQQQQQQQQQLPQALSPPALRDPGSSPCLLLQVLNTESGSTPHRRTSPQQRPASGGRAGQPLLPPAHEGERQEEAHVVEKELFRDGEGDGEGALPRPPARPTATRSPNERLIRSGLGGTARAREVVTTDSAETSVADSGVGMLSPQVSTVPATQHNNASVTSVHSQHSRSSGGLLPTTVATMSTSTTRRELAAQRRVSAPDMAASATETPSVRGLEGCPRSREGSSTRTSSGGGGTSERRLAQSRQQQQQQQQQAQPSSTNHRGTTATGAATSAPSQHPYASPSTASNGLNTNATAHASSGSGTGPRKSVPLTLGIDAVNVPAAVLPPLMGGQGGGVRVLRLAPAEAAATAGVQVGDVILAVALPDPHPPPHAGRQHAETIRVETCVELQQALLRASAQGVRQLRLDIYRQAKHRLLSLQCVL